MWGIVTVMVEPEGPSLMAQSSGTGLPNWEGDEGKNGVFPSALMKRTFFAIINSLPCDVSEDLASFGSVLYGNAQILAECIQAFQLEILLVIIFQSLVLGWFLLHRFPCLTIIGFRIVAHDFWVVGKRFARSKVYKMIWGKIILGKCLSENRTLWRVFVRCGTKWVYIVYRQRWGKRCSLLLL